MTSSSFPAGGLGNHHGMTARERIEFLDALATEERGPMVDFAYTTRMADPVGTPSKPQTQGDAPRPRTAPLGPPPARAIRDPRDAEELAALHLRWLGFRDATITPQGPDGGVDVRGTGVLAQVKAEMKPVRVQVVQPTYGIARHEDCRAVVFALSGFTEPAALWASTAKVPLFQFDLMGRAAPVNVHAERLRP